jgi:hypothetical protein
VKKRFALLIGAAGGGTSRLFRLLASHPQVLPCRVKEPRYFSDDRKWALGLDWYRSLWDFVEPDERVALEASSDYASHPHVPCPAQRIAQTPAGFRFLYLLRDPVERIERHHAGSWREGEVEFELSEGALRRHIDLSRYARQLEAYREHFPREDFLLLRAEELDAAPAALLRRVAIFLEIDPHLAAPGPGSAPAAAGSGAGEPAWWARLPGLARLARGEPAPRQERRFALSPAQRERVARELRDDRARLERDWEFDTSAWSLAQSGAHSRR